MSADPTTDEGTAPEVTTSTTSTASTASTARTGGTAARRARQAAQADALAPRPGSRRTTSTSGAVPSAPAGRALQSELDPDRLAALEEERDFLLRSLADLEREHDAGDVDEHDYAALKDDYTVRAAATLRAIETRHATMHAVRPPASRARVWAGVALVVLVAVGLGVFVAASAGRRGAADSLSGGTRQTTRDQLLQAEQMMGTDPRGALDLFEQVLRTSPDNVEALTFKGWLLYQSASGATADQGRQLLVDSALDSLNKAVAADPTAQDARIFRASLYSREGQPERAAQDLTHVDRANVPPFLTELYDNLVARVDAGTSTPGTQP